MKKIIVFIILILAISIKTVKAETFVEGNFIQGEYINKKINNKTYYMTMQFIKDSNGNIVYCLEPFVEFYNNKTYSSYTDNLESLTGLNSNQVRQVELIAYYGYGYQNRTEDKWYVITQYLIWLSVCNSDIYFTNTLNGTRINKYQTEIDELLNDVNNHDEIPFFIKNYTVNYNDNFNLYLDDYYIVSSDKKENNINIENIKDNITINVSKKSNYYNYPRTVFLSYESQNLIKPGDIENKTYEINIEVTKGKLELNINDKADIYSEAKFEQICYVIYQEKQVDKVCTDDPIKYTTDYLPYGKYEIKQITTGEGYIKDEKTYEINLDKELESIDLDNFIIKGILLINKKYDTIYEESNALFNIYNITNELLTTLETDEEGKVEYILGYGTYLIEQTKGIDGYLLNEPFSISINDNEETIIKELNDEKIIIEETKPSNIIPPNTRVKVKRNFYLLPFIIYLIIRRNNNEREEKQEKNNCTSIITA